MIPSRPLDLGAIIGESIRIVKLIYWRSAVLLLCFFAPGFVIMHIGMDSLIDSGEEAVQKFESASPESPALLRDYIISTGTLTSSSTYYFRFQYPKLFSAIDSLKYSLNAKYPDSSARSVLKSQIDSIAKIVGRSNPIRAGNFLSGLIYLLIGLFIFILGGLANIAAGYDLSARAFEERPLEFTAIFALALKRTLWFTAAQYLMIWLAMIFGFSIVVAITFLISPILGGLGVVASFVAMLYGLLRTIFAPVALVSEELGPVEGIKRSLALTEGMFWRIFGIGLIGWIIATTLSTLLRLPFSLAFSPGTDWLIKYIRGNEVNVAKAFQEFRSMVYKWEVLILFSSLISVSFTPAFLTTFYYDLRTRIDGPLEYHDESENEGKQPPSASEETFEEGPTDDSA